MNSAAEAGQAVRPLARDAGLIVAIPARCQLPTRRRKIVDDVSWALSKSWLIAATTLFQDDLER